MIPKLFKQRRRNKYPTEEHTIIMMTHSYNDDPQEFFKIEKIIKAHAVLS